MAKNEKKTGDIRSTATPVARKIATIWAQNGKDLADKAVQSEICEIIKIEQKVYQGMKDALITHIKRHHLDADALVYFKDFEKIKQHNEHNYAQLLSKLRHKLAKLGNQVAESQKYFLAYQRRCEILQYELRSEKEPARRNLLTLDLQTSTEKREELSEELRLIMEKLGNMEYLISKIEEYLQKVHSLKEVATELILSGKAPDLREWSDKVLLQDNLFEENKQFLKQALHHLETLEQNKCRLGVADLRMLLYHKDGCRREKLHHQVEEWIIKIYNSLTTEAERREIYPEICRFLEEVIPMSGYISLLIINFIVDRDFISRESRDLLIKIQPIIAQWNMTILITKSIEHLYDAAMSRKQEASMTESDVYVLEVMEAYKGLPRK